jgi:hypothetical protein
MAGDWIKMRTSLLTNPKVNGIAKALEADSSVCDALSTGYGGVMSEIVKRNVMRHVTVSSLLVVWGSANEHTKDGVFVNSDLADLDDMTGIPSFGEAMASVGWAIYDEESNSVTLPNFNEYNTSGSVRSATAKSNAQRQKEYRERQKSQQSDVTSDVTPLHESNRREEKRREEKKVNTERESSPRATRLSPDLTLPDDWSSFCQTERPDLDPAKTFDKFRDYWTAKAGKDGAKLDWLATWRNWVREERKQFPPAKQATGKHAGFSQLNYREGIEEDGTLA